MKTNTQIITTPNGTVYNQVWVDDKFLCIKFRDNYLGKWLTFRLDKKVTPMLIDALNIVQKEIDES